MDYSKSTKVSSFKAMRIIILGICIHSLLLIAVFETYFNSPLEQGMSPVKSTDRPVSRRVVIFVTDGLRARAILDKNENNTPFLTSIRKTRGAWGVSFARVPTESRPNQVAIFAGIHEDPSAIYKGWKEFPIDYDTVFRHAKNAWILGVNLSVKLFGKFKGQKRNNITTYSAPLALEYFKKQNQTVPDKYVMEKMAEVLRTEKHGPRFRQQGNVFALFLTGLDMTGHTLKPTSKEYVDHLKFVDQMVNQTEVLVNETFGDRATTFIFTSDHGMTDWGSHGAGSEDEVATPFIVWGAGIKVNKTRNDVRQIDIAPLISALLGLYYPLNSLGKTPLHLFNLTTIEKIELISKNLWQVFRIFEVKQKRMKNRTAVYEPFLNEVRLRSKMAQMNNKTNQLEELNQLFDKITKDVEHFNDFLMFTILFCVALGLFLWIVYLSTFLIPYVQQPPVIEKNIPEVILILSSVFLISLCFFYSFSLMYYFYIMFPNIMFYLLLKERHKIPFIFSSELNLEHLWIVCCTISFVGVFILSFHKRVFFSLMMLMISPIHSRTNRGLAWFVLCLVLAIFPVFPVMLTDFKILQFVLGYITWKYLSFFVLTTQPDKFQLESDTSLKRKVIFVVGNICFDLSFLAVLYSMSENLFILRCFCWVFFLLPIVIVPFSDQYGNTRVYTIFMAFSSFYIMTTMSFEMIFLTFYTLLLIVWIEIENDNKGAYEKKWGNFWRGIIYISLILIGYFGTGNIASISSFDPMWVRCLTIYYSPCTIAILILLKQTIPFLYATCAFRKIALGSRMNLTVSFCTILLLSDIIVFCFMFSIRNTGSWSDMSSSLSRFVIAECFAVGILCFYFVAFVLSDLKVSIDFIGKLLERIR